MNTPLIEFENVSKSFDDRLVLDQVNLSIYQGEITTIIGKSGAGKSVFLKHIIGLLKPDSGRIFYEGRALSEMTANEKKKLKRRFSYMFQHNALFDSMSVFENIALPIKERSSLSDEEIRQRVLKRLEQFELLDVLNKFPSQISGGMQKRVALARALVTEPEIILFDEPTTGLDPLRKNAVFSMIAHYQREVGFTAVMVSHDIPDVFFISNRVAIIASKKIIFQGSPIELEQSENRVVRTFVEGQENLRDDLTGLMGRYEFEQRICEEIENLSKESSLSIVWFNIEDLSYVRENVGFIAAQRIMQTLGQAIRHTFGFQSESARYSSNSIVTAIPGMKKENVRMKLQEMGELIKNRSVTHNSGANSTKCIEFKIMAGIAEALSGDTLQDAAARASENSEVISTVSCRDSKG